ncbi:AMP-binding protein [Parasphingopyxis algicola]|uniref:AMP-binding protein n=1 Tax=Parasphingopyxis algicola TaxID=2026624 RepID=UPI0015A495AE|nr:AMP-binding protein [Parasphingopyxis algicola]QLC26510.1 AMP-binding protein [Parasphingopyxis algicola]
MQIDSLSSWQAMRSSCREDPGAFHGEIAKRRICWFLPDEGENGAWVNWDEQGDRWTGWNAATAEPVTPDLPADFEPWDRAFNGDDPPNWRWFEGGLTSAAFNEVDRHVLAGHGEEAALIFEGDRWNMAEDGGRGGPVDSYPVSRKKLLLESAKCALALKALGLQPGDRIALNMPSIAEQIYWTEGAKRLGIVYTPVFGGFSDKTLSDRIADAGARVVITADGSYRNAQMAPFKPMYTDPALDNFVAVPVAMELLDAALADGDLGVEAGRADVIRATVAELLEGEVTVERSDVMRGVGKALAEMGQGGGIDARQSAQLRIAVASALVDSPPRVEAVIVVRHTAQPDLIWNDDRDRWSHELTDTAGEELLAAARDAGFDVSDEDALLALPDADLVRAVWASSPVLAVDAEYPNFIIYTSGSTGKPKGVVHVHGGYCAGVAATMPAAFGAEPGDTMYVVADPGWITGQSYLIAASLLCRVTTIVTEGSPVFPHAGRFASIIERYDVDIFKAGVTFLKSVMQNPENLKDIERYDLSSLKVATFCAEPVSPAVQAFAMEHVAERYINSYWATEHGGIVWTHFHGNDDFPLRADAHTYPLPWILGDVWIEDTDGRGDSDAVPLPRNDEDGGVAWRRADIGEKGEIIIRLPYPYLARTIWGDAEGFTVETDGRTARVAPTWRGNADRYADTYWKRWRGAWAYTQGDFAMRHEDGSYSLHGRSDDVINVSGHRIGTEEIEGAILRDKALDPNSPVGNVLVIGAPHREKGATPVAFVTPAAGQRLTQEDRNRLAGLVRTEKGAVAVPSDFIELAEFPETRSGKYMRRMVRAVVEGEDVGDVSTLRNPESLDDLARAVDAWKRKQQLADEQQLFERYRFFLIQYNRVAPGKRVATVTVTNPPVNALNERALDELGIIVDHLARKDDVVAVVFTGAGSQSFVAGADIRQMLEEVNSVAEAKALPDNAQLAFGKIETMGKPCIAAIQGVALGGGMEFALACHYRIADPKARFGQPEINLRLLPGYGGTQRLPRLLAAKRGETGLRDALDLILGGRAIDADQALAIGAVDALAAGSDDALSRAHAMVREYVMSPTDSLLGQAFAERERVTENWSEAADIDLDAVLEDDFLQRVLGQLAWAGRDKAGERALDAIRTGWQEGMAAGLDREAQRFAEAIIDPEGGKTGIQQFMDKQSPPLPVRRSGVWIDEEHEPRKAAMIGRGDLLPVGAPFYPGVTPIPDHQLAFGIARDPDTGAPRFGPPATHERELIVPVPRPEANEALVYLLSSEVNFNDIWALTGIPVSPFDAHDEDVQTTGSGGLALIAALGSELKAEGRLKVGDLVNIYSGTNDLLSPEVGNDPMYAGFSIQGYETKTGSHAQFLTVQGPQLHRVPGDLTLEQAGAYTLNLGTITRCLFTTLDIKPGRTIFVEGAATGTGLDALKSSVRTGLAAVGMVSSADRAEFVRGQGAVGAINRKAPEIADCFTPIPDDPDAARQWEAEGEALLDSYRDMTGGKLADYVVSHAGERAFPRSFQLLEENGTLAFYGASSGYHFSFMGKPGEARPEEMLQRANLRGGESVLLYYGPNSRDLADETGLEMIEAARLFKARIVIVSTTDGQREFLQSLGLEESIEGVVSLETLKRRDGANFHWPDTLPRLPDAKQDIENFKIGVRDYQQKTMKPFGTAIGKLLRSPGNPRGVPDIVFERAGQDTLGVSTSLVKPFGGRVVYAEEMAGRRYTFYAPQVWTRQRRIFMPGANIFGTHLCNAHEVTFMNNMVSAGLLDVTEPLVVPWEGLPDAHQSMWDNKHSGATYVVNHALPAMGLRSRDELFEYWAAAEAEPPQQE